MLRRIVAGNKLGKESLHGRFVHPDHDFFRGCTVTLTFRCLAVFMIAVLAVAENSQSALPDETSATSAGIENAANELERGTAFERAEQWDEAVAHYERALKKTPNDKDLEYALRRARIQMSVSRRYLDESYQELLKSIRVSDMSRLLSEVYGKIESDYLDPISVTRFVSHGTESLYMGLANSHFLKLSAPQASVDRIASVRATLVKQYWNREVQNLQEAWSLIEEISSLCGRNLGISQRAVVLEYIFGGINALDHHSVLLTEDENRAMNSHVHGNLVGIGVVIQADSQKGILLERVFQGGPAAAGGLQAGDHIIAINGQDCRGVTTNEAASLLRGEPNSTVRLTYSRADGRQYTNSFRRQNFTIPSVAHAEMIDPARGIGYIRLEHFQDRTLAELDEAIENLRSQGMQALVWDLRGNPGGQLDVAHRVAQRFISDGVIVRTRGRGRNQSQEMLAGSLAAHQFPLALLVDENSASASEIIAGAVRDHNRGVIVGRTTFGKWSVQTIMPLTTRWGMALKMTTARFYSPHDHNYAGRGLEPDVAVPSAADVETLFFRPVAGEELRQDPDVVEAISVLDGRLSRNRQ